MEIENKLREIVAEQLDVDLEQVRMESSFLDDLHADSLAVVELIMAFEEAFEISIPDEDTRGLQTVKDAVDYISSKLTSAA
jgi:acyl carrier protein